MEPSFHDLAAYISGEFFNMQFHVLSSNSLFKVLFNFSSRYLSTIGLVDITWVSFLKMSSTMSDPLPLL